jgi:hypothetical protein
MRTQQAVQEGKLPRKLDMQTLEEVPEAWELMDKIEQLELETKDKTPSLPPKSLPAKEPNKSYRMPPPLIETPKQEPKSAVTQVRQSRLSEDGTKEPPPKRRVLSSREKDYLEFFDQKFGPLIVLVLYIAFADLQKATFYAPSPQECHDVAPHLAHIGPKVEDFFHFPKWVHEVVTTSDDTFTVGMVLVGYLDRIGVLENLLPWFSGAASKVRRINNNEQTPGSNGAVPYTSGPRVDDVLRAHPGVRSTEPVVAFDAREQSGPLPDLSNVIGLGEQYRPV